VQDLDLIGIRAGTDKSRLRQDYLRQYQRMLSGFVDTPITIIEIGLHRGASLLLWEKFFPLAHIVGVDISPTVKRMERDRVSIEVGSQFDAEFLARLSAKYRPNVIVDDGSHLAEHQIFTFEHLFPSLVAGGVYIIEDLSPGDQAPAVGHFLRLHRNILQRRHETLGARAESIPGAIAVWKEPAADELDGNFEVLAKEAAQSGDGEALLYLAEYMHRLGALAGALETARAAAAIEPNNLWIQFGVCKIQHDMGDRSVALASILDATRNLSHFPEVIARHIKRWSAE
jgi:hypothetical protein